MASGSFNVSSGNQWINTWVEWSSYPNTAGNYSTVYATLYASRNNTGFTTKGSGTFSMTISGGANPSGSNSASFTVTYNSRTPLVSWSTTVAHASNGVGGTTISVSGGMPGTTLSSVSGSGYCSLGTIPRASSISSFPAFTVNGSSAVSISRADASFTHTLELYIGSTHIKSWTGVATSQTLSFTTAEQQAIYNTMSGNNAVTATLYCYTYSGSTHIGTSSKTATLSKPSASTLTASSFTLGNTISMTVNRNSTMFTHTISLKIGSVTVVTKTGVGASLNIELTSAEQNILYSAIDKATSATVHLICTTYSGSIQIGSATTVNITCSIPSSVIPTQPIITLTGVNLLNGSYIQRVSSVKVDVSSSGTKYAQISKWSITVNGTAYTTNSFTTGVLKTSGTNIVSVTVTDSRGRTNSESATFSVIAYDVPVINSFVVERCTWNGSEYVLDDVGESVRVSVVGSVSDLGGNNTLNWVVYSRARGTTPWDNVQSGATDTEVFYKDNYLVTNAYDFRLELVDRYNMTPYELSIPTGETAFSIGRQGTGHGKVYQKGAIDALGDVYIEGLNGNPALMSFPNGRHAKYIDTLNFSANDIVDEWVLFGGKNGQTYAPIGGYWFYINTISHVDTNQRKQIAYEYMGDRVYTRRCVEGVWGEWTPLMNNPYLRSKSIADANALTRFGLDVAQLRSNGVNKPPGEDHALLTMNYNPIWSAQLGADWRTNQWYTRTQENGTWKPWQVLWDTKNSPGEGANNGYQKFANGIIMQWCKIDVVHPGGQNYAYGTATLPIAFPTYGIMVQTTCMLNVTLGNISYIGLIGVGGNFDSKSAVSVELMGVNSSIPSGTYRIGILAIGV